MTELRNTEFYLEVAKGNVPGHRIVHKFGSGNIGTSSAAISATGGYMTPTSAVALEFLSSSANDTAAGSGAREITVIGTDATWNEVEFTIATNGITPVALPTALTRLYRWYVSGSGTYATIAAPSHAGVLTLRAAGGGATWDTITPGSIYPAQSKIGALTIPIGETGYIISEDIFVDSVKAANIYLLQRPAADVIVAPFSARRLIGSFIGLTGAAPKNHLIPKGGFAGPCDLGYVGNTNTGTADVVVEFDVLLIQDGF